MKRRPYPRAALPMLVLCLVAAAAMLVSPAASGQGGRLPAQDIEQALASFDRLSLDPAALLNGARQTGRVTLQTSRGTFDLDVEPFDIRAKNYRAVAADARGVMRELPPAVSNSWRGKVSGAENTFVRLVLDGERLQGIIITPGETFYVEPVRDLTPAAAGKEYVFYAGSDVKQTDGECGVTLAGKIAERAAAAGLTNGSGAATTSALSTPKPEEIFAPMPEADIATEADFEFFQLSGNSVANANSDILNIMTQVDGIYESQLGMSMRVVFQRVWTTNTDPYTLTDSEDALFEFAENYDDTFLPGAPPTRDLTHMFTGKEFDGSTIGIAFTGVVCDAPPASYGISESKFLENNPSPGITPIAQRVAVTAHEIGHNFSASHTSPVPPATPNCDTANSIMNASVTGSSNFCQFSRDQITSHVTGTGGSCLTRLTQPGCSYGITPATGFYTVAGGAGNVNVMAGGGCLWGVAEGAPWVTFTGPQAGTGDGATAYTVAPNDGKDGPRRAFIDIGGQTLAISQQGSPACLATATPISMGQTLNGTLATTDCIASQPNRLTAFEDLYTFVARAGQRVRIEMTATTDIDTYLYLFGPDGTIVAENDDIVLGVNTNSRIPVAAGQFFLLPQTGVYTIAATTFGTDDPGRTGSYTIRLSDNSAANSVALSSAAYSVNEDVSNGLGTDGTGQRVVTVTRSGDTTGTATVDYATSDGTASRQKDYIQTLGTLVFAPGEASKTFTVLVVDDVFQEGPETVQITLSNPTGTTLGATTTATLTINSADSVSGPSPVRAQSFNTAFFVRQQYLDFFSREPDAGGFAFWQNEINSCGANAGCLDVKRVNVSAAFFVSIEFQETGFLVYRAFKTAYGDATSPGVAGTVPVIRLNEFLPDTQRIGQGVIVNVGDWRTQLEANKQAYFLEFILRPRFITAFPLSMTAAEFVDKLNQNAGGVLSTPERDQLVAQLNNAANQSAARAAVLRAVAEHPTLTQNEFRRAFVLMQYYGYLRRNPDDAPEQNLNFAGWAFWLGKLNENNGNYVQAEMVNAFLTSFEYIDRFGTRP